MAFDLDGCARFHVRVLGLEEYKSGITNRVGVLWFLGRLHPWGVQY